MLQVCENPTTSYKNGFRERGGQDNIKEEWVSPSKVGPSEPNRAYSEFNLKGIKTEPGIWYEQKDFLPDLTDSEAEESESEEGGGGGLSDSSDSTLLSDDDAASVQSGQTSEILSFGSEIGDRDHEEKPVDFTPKDTFMYCSVCAEWVEGSCSDHIDFLETTMDTSSLELPDNLELKASEYHPTKTGVYAKESIPEGCVMGPFKGPFQEDHVGMSIRKLKYVWEVKEYNGRSKYLLDEESGGGEGGHNWMINVRFVRYRQSQNVMALQFCSEVYYKSIREIEAGEELACYRGAGLPWTEEIPKEDLLAPSAPLRVNGSNYNTYSCEHCPALFATKKLLASHLSSRRHNPSDNIICHECNFVASSRVELRKHMNKLHSKNPFQCPLCPKTFKTSMNHQKHIKIVHSSGRKEKKHKCMHCPKSFQKRHHLRNHQATHEENRFECYKCGQKLATEYNLKSHIESQHSDMTFACPSCGKEHNSKGAMKIHWKKYHTAKGAAKQQAKQLESTRKKIESIAASSTQKEIDKVCRFCQVVFHNMGSRKRHETRKHIEELRKLLAEEQPKELTGKFNCEHCIKSFSSAVELRYHMRRHSGKLDYACERCGRAYPTGSELNKHHKRSVCGRQAAAFADADADAGGLEVGAQDGADEFVDVSSSTSTVTTSGIVVDSKSELVMRNSNLLSMKEEVM